MLTQQCNLNWVLHKLCNQWRSYIVTLVFGASYIPKLIPYDLESLWTLWQCVVVGRLRCHSIEMTGTPDTISMLRCHRHCSDCFRIVLTWMVMARLCDLESSSDYARPRMASTITTYSGNMQSLTISHQELRKFHVIYHHNSNWIALSYRI